MKARVLASRGEHEEAEALARAAVERIRPTEFLDLRSDAIVHLAEVLIASGRTSDARAALHQAIDGYRRKGNLAGARRVRERLAMLG